MNKPHIDPATKPPEMAESLPAPRGARSIRLDPSLTAQDSFTAIMGECVEQVVENIAAVRVSDDPEGAHQLRIALRRLRTALGLFKPFLGRAETTALNQEARRLGAEVGRLRDIDVVREDFLLPRAAAAPDIPVFAELVELLEARGRVAREDLRATLGKRHTLSILRRARRLAEPPERAPAANTLLAELRASPVNDFARAALAHQWNRTEKRAHGLSDFTPEERHALRKELKRLRYAIEFFSPLFNAKQASAFLRRLKALQVVFGDLNDAAVAERVLGDLDEPGALRPEAQQAIGRILGAAEERSERRWGDARTHWKALRSQKRFWK